VAGTRISLDSVVCAFKRGDSPERILERYPLLGKPAKVYGAIAFYLDHQAEIDAYLEASNREFEASAGPPLSKSNPALWERLQRARTEALEPQPYSGSKPTLTSITTSSWRSAAGNAPWTSHPPSALELQYFRNTSLRSAIRFSPFRFKRSPLVTESGSHVELTWQSSELPTPRYRTRFGRPGRAGRT